MKKIAFLIMLLASSAARGDAISDEVRCFIVSLQLMQAVDPAQKLAGTVAQSYWMGRIDGHTPKIDLEASVLAEIPQIIKPGIFQAEAMRCGTEMQALGAEVKAIGESLQRKGAAMLHDEQFH